MIRILLSGCGGRMGRAVSAYCANSEEFTVAAGVDPAAPECPYPVYASFDRVNTPCDVIVDFSFHAAVSELLDYAVKQNCPAVIATTGFTEDELEKIGAASEKIPVFRSANMSIGVNLLCRLCKEAAMLLPDFDIEIIEKHHNQKVDSPSGTALMIADQMRSVLPEEMHYTFGRHGIVGKRDPKEIGIHAIRGGTVVGEHEVLFAGFQETLTITHTMLSREVLASGAVCAARFLVDQKTPGLYGMDDMLS
ncbi:MAG: 4-hydroxy-tetrahydrodipicolinate reductase [Clostridia bacterium]|nr:4-hydroxy-tetrahydrodipicolinate reductase [Clostridia bacterium]